MQKVEEHSLPVKILVAAVFLLLGVAALFAFSYKLVSLIDNIASHSKIIVFDKGAMYMFGVGMTTGFLVFLMIYEILQKKITARLNKIATYVGTGFLGLIFLFPMGAGFVVQGYIDNIGYVYCSKQSSRWLHAQTLVYAASEADCEMHTLDKFISGRPRLR